LIRDPWLLSDSDQGFDLPAAWIITLLPKPVLGDSLESIVASTGSSVLSSLDLNACMTGGRQYVSLAPEFDRVRAGKRRWQWLAQVLHRQGLVCGRVDDEMQDPAAISLEIRSDPAAVKALRWRLRIPTVADDIDCHRLFEKAFGEPAFSALWRWKYGNGRGRSIIAVRGDRVIAHYGGVSRRVYRNGHIERAIQITDVMVDPAERAVMTRSGAFLQVARASQEYFLGCEAEHDFGFGFPNQRHMLLAHRLGLYDEVERLVELEWSAQPAATTSLTRAEVVDPCRLDPRRVDALWQRMRAGLADRILVARDAGYWFYRYAENPSPHYVMLAIRHKLTRRILGLVVLRRKEQEVQLLDMLAAPKYFSLLAAHAQAQAADWGVPVLHAWITRSSARWFETPSVRVNQTDIVIPLNTHLRMHATDDFRDRWFLMMGDTDFL
jgi:hypothetical protein